MLLQVTACVLLFLPHNAVSIGCDRSPESTEEAKTEGNNGFHVNVYIHPKNTSLPSPEGYIPGELYTGKINDYSLGFLHSEKLNFFGNFCLANQWVP